ncbi:MAG: hypothetical protein JNM39_06340 [Bdellovibrionaceae bacterium]|nr:hypothetical protein [Pseudobdellovibrionaceae bacterium]
MCVSAINVFTGQPTAAIVGDYKLSEWQLLKQIISKFDKRELSLLDRGLGGLGVYLEYHLSGQFFIHRAKTTGDRVAIYIQDFLTSKKKQKVQKITARDEESGDDIQMELRLIFC